ncbi:MAG: hypothetical protein ABJA71_12540 [Ginsengibacter sp.]
MPFIFNIRVGPFPELIVNFYIILYPCLFLQQSKHLVPFNMKLFPSSAIQQLEFDKIQILLEGHCRTEFAKNRAQALRIHTHKEFIEPELRQTHEYKLLFLNHVHFPDDAVFNLSKELKLLSIDGSLISGGQFLSIRKLVVAIQQVFRWFDNDRRITYPFLVLVIQETYFEKTVIEIIDEVLDEMAM